MSPDTAGILSWIAWRRKPATAIVGMAVAGCVRMVSGSVEEKSEPGKEVCQ
jgi:hypothetical protein